MLDFLGLGIIPSTIDLFGEVTSTVGARGKTGTGVRDGGVL